MQSVNTWDGEREGINCQEMEARKTCLISHKSKSRLDPFYQRVLSLADWQPE